MSCLRLPRSLDDAGSIIAECSGVTDWVPQALIGLAAVAVIGLVVVTLLIVLRRS